MWTRIIENIDKPKFPTQWERSGILLAGEQGSLGQYQVKLVRAHSKAPQSIQPPCRVMLHHTILQPQQTQQVVSLISPKRVNYIIIADLHPRISHCLLRKKGELEYLIYSIWIIRNKYSENLFGQFKARFVFLSDQGMISFYFYTEHIPTASLPVHNMLWICRKTQLWHPVTRI